MDCFALTRALVDLDSTTGQEKPVVEYLFAQLGTLAAQHKGRLERMSAGARPRQFAAYFWRTGGHVVDAHGHGSAILFFKRRWHAHSRPGRLRCQGNYCGDDGCGGIAAGGGYAEFCVAVCCGRRAGQRWRESGGSFAAWLAVSDQWRAYTEPVGARLQGCVALRNCGRRGDWRIRHTRSWDIRRFIHCSMRCGKFAPSLCRTIRFSGSPR